MGPTELWYRMRKRGYSRSIAGPSRVMRGESLLPPKPAKNRYRPKLYEWMTRPGKRVQIDMKIILNSRIADPRFRLYQYIVIDKHSRLRILRVYSEQNTNSSAEVFKKFVVSFEMKGIKVQCVQTDNAIEFNNRFSNGNSKKRTLFEAIDASLHIRHKLIQPYTPRHNGRVEHSHREDQRFSTTRIAFSDSPTLVGKLAARQSRTNNRPMRCLSGPLS